MEIKILMLLPHLRYDENMRVPPQIGICSYLTNFGHKVSWVICADSAQKGHPFMCNEVNIHITSINRSFHKFSMLWKIYEKILHTLKRMHYIQNLIRKRNYNVVFVRDSIFDGLIAAYIKKKSKFQFVYEMSNPLEQNWVSHKYYSKHKCFWYVVSKIDVFLVMHLLNQADLVLPSSKWMIDYLVERRIDRSKIMDYPNGIDPIRFSVANGVAIREKYNLNNSNIIIYVGSLHEMRHLEVLIRAFSKIRSNKDNVKLLLVGEGNGTDRLNYEKLAKDLGLEKDVIFTGQVKPQEVPSFIDASDIGISAVPPLNIYRRGAAIKMYEYMAMKKPVIANRELLGHSEVIEQSGGGILVNFEDDSMAIGILKLLNDQDEMKKMGNKGYEWVMKNRTYEILARRLEERFLKLLKT